MNFAMPYMIQVMREYISKVDKLEQSDQIRTENEESNDTKPIDFSAQGPLMITGPGMGMYPQGGYGAAAGMYAPYGGAPTYPGYWRSESFLWQPKIISSSVLLMWSDFHLM